MESKSACVLLTVVTMTLVVPVTPVAAQDSGTVGATVTVAAAPGACLTVSTSAVDFGTQPLRKADEVAVSPTYSITNCGSSPIDLFARGTDATGAPWLLTEPALCPSEPNRFAVDVLFAGAPTNLDKLDRQVGSLDAGRSDDAVNHGLFMPCEGSDGAGQKVSFDIHYTAVAR